MGIKLAKVKLDSESVAKLVSAMSLVRANFLTGIGYEHEEASIVSFRDPPHSQVMGNAQRSTRQPPSVSSGMLITILNVRIHSPVPKKIPVLFVAKIALIKPLS